MADSERRQRGVEMMKKVYAGDVVTPPAGAMPFSDLMLEQLFAEVWTRETLPVRDRRLVLLGIIGALGERDTFQIQVKAALKNGELTPAQVREVVITLANYAGYPRAAAQVVATEQTIAAVEKEKKGEHDEARLRPDSRRSLPLASTRARPVERREIQARCASGRMDMFARRPMPEDDRLEDRRVAAPPARPT